MDKINSMGDSLVNRHVYSVCCTSMDDVFHSDLYKLRKAFFEGGMKKCSLKSNSQDTGLDIKIRGRMGKHFLKWKKSSRKLALEEAFAVAKNHVVVKRDLNGSICGKITFDEDMDWVKTEYFSGSDYMLATVILKPDTTKNAIEKFTYNKENRRYEVESLLPTPYMHGSAEQSIVNAQNGDNLVLAATDQGEFCYCPEKEHRDRIRTIEDIKAGNIMMMPAWEIKDGEIPENAKDTDPVIEFKNLVDVCENIEKSQSDDSDKTENETSEEDDSDKKTKDTNDSSTSETPENTGKDSDTKLTEKQLSADTAAENNEPAVECISPALESKEAAKSETASAEASCQSVADDTKFINGVSEASEAENTGSITSEDLELTIENSDNFNPKTMQLSADGEEFNYTGRMQDGKREGRGRTDQSNGLTAFDGEYKNNMKDGFGASYYKDGDMSYVGSWKEDKKDGVGISFRRKDHAIHIAKWENGTPDAHTTLIDSDGNLKFSGRIVDGKKQGAGVSYRKSDDTIFVGKYTDGNADTYGSLFDNEGHLIYTGQWKNGMRNGTGTEFDANGQIVYSGEWKDDKYLNGILYQKV